jgi:hypothetical protein
VASASAHTHNRDVDASSRPEPHWNWGTWTIAIGPNEQTIPLNGGWLDEWLGTRGLARTDLDFGGSRAMEQRFINDFGPIA